MPKRSLREDYLLRAAKADVQFHAAKGEERDAWERIVVGYLELAEIELRKTFGLPWPYGIGTHRETRQRMADDEPERRQCRHQLSAGGGF